MKIVAILDVNEKFFDESEDASSYTLDEMVDKFEGYYERPVRDKEALVVTKESMYCVFGQDVHRFEWGKDF